MWIEIIVVVHLLIQVLSLPLQECGLKLQYAPAGDL